MRQPSSYSSVLKQNNDKTLVIEVRDEFRLRGSRWMNFTKVPSRICNFRFPQLHLGVRQTRKFTHVTDSQLAVSRIRWRSTSSTADFGESTGGRNSLQFGSKIIRLTTVAQKSHRLMAFSKS